VGFCLHIGQRSAKEQRKQGILGLVSGMHELASEILDSVISSRSKSQVSDSSSHVKTL